MITPAAESKLSSAGIKLADKHAMRLPRGAVKIGATLIIIIATAGLALANN